MSSPSKSDQPKKLLPVQDWLATLPTKRSATQVIYRNLQGEVLITKPTYRKDWLLPGGIVEAKESPLACAMREVEEELGFVPKFLVFAGVDFSSDDDHDFDFLHFIFDGGVLGDDEIKQMIAEEDEIEEIRFVQVAKLGGLLNAEQLVRVHAFLESFPTPILLTNGKRMIEINHGFLSPQLVAMASATVIKNDNKYLLVQEAQARAYKQWNFPAGKVDAGETPEIAAVREAQEETGLEVAVGRILYSKRKKSDNTLLMALEVTEYSGKITIPEDEILDAQWFSALEIIDMKDQLRDPEFILGAIEESERGE